MAELITIGLRVDASGVKRGVSEAERELDKITTLSTTVGRTTTAAGNTFSQTGLKMERFGATVRGVATRIGELGAVLVRGRGLLGRFATALGGLGAGGLVTLGVLAGFAALRAGFDRLGDRARLFADNFEASMDRIRRSVQGLQRAQLQQIIDSYESRYPRAPGPEREVTLVNAARRQLEALDRREDRRTPRTTRPRVKDDGKARPFDAEILRPIDVSNRPQGKPRPQDFGKQFALADLERAEAALKRFADKTDTELTGAEARWRQFNESIRLGFEDAIASMLTGQRNAFEAFFAYVQYQLARLAAQSLTASLLGGKGSPGLLSGLFGAAAGAVAPGYVPPAPVVPNVPVPTTINIQAMDAASFHEYLGRNRGTLMAHVTSGLIDMPMAGTVR